MKCVLLFILVVIGFVAHAQQDTSATTPKTTDSTGKKTIDSPQVKKEIVEEGLTYQREAIIVDDSTYQVVLTSHKDKYYTLSVHSSTDSSSVKSLIRLNPNFGFPVFRNLLFELLNKITLTKTKLQTKADVEFQVSALYNTFQDKVKIQTSPEVAQLKDQLSMYEGLLEEKYRYGGTIAIKNDTIVTYRHYVASVMRDEKKKLNRKIDYQQKKIDSLERIIKKQESKNEEVEENELFLDKKAKDDISHRQDTIAVLLNLQQAHRDKKAELIGERNNLENSYSKTDGIFIADSVFLEFFNSTVDKLAIYGRYIIDPKTGGPSRQITYNDPIRAYNRSFGLRGLNITDYYFTVNRGSTNEYAIKLSDLLTYKKFKNNFSYIVKDQAVTLRADSVKSQPLERRALYDYLSLITFVDFLGLSNAVNNNFIQIEGRARFPMHLSTRAGRTFGNLTFLPMFETYLNASFVNGNNVGGRKGTIMMNPARDTYFYDHFDLVRNYNIKGGMSLGIFSLQYKGIHSKIYGAVDLKMYRTSFGLTKVNSGLDSIINSNVYSLSYAPTIIFEYRPDFNIGADLRLSMDCNLSPLNFESGSMKYLPTKGPVTEGENEYQGISKKQKIVYGLELNAYSFLTPNREKNDGIYFRFAIFTNRNITSISPYILAGYATSLKGLVKSSKK